MAIVELLSSFEPANGVFVGKALKFGTAYYTVTIILNVSMTALICARLTYHSRYVRNTVLGPGGSEVYDRIAAILIEAAVPYTLLGIAFLIPYAMSSDLAIAFGEVWGAVVVRGISRFRTGTVPKFILHHIGSFAAVDHPSCGEQELMGSECGGVSSHFHCVCSR